MNQPPILLVEDNPRDVTLMLRGLKKANIANDVLVARDGVEARDFLLCGGSLDDGQTLAELPSVVLLDLQMPRMNGIELLRELRADARTRLLPVVMLTTSGEEGDLLQSYESGVNSYVRKPVDFSEFAQAIEQLGLYWVLVNRSIHSPY